MSSVCKKPIALAVDPTRLVLPLAPMSVPAGFAGLVADVAEERLDLLQMLVRHPQATFLWRARGISMREAGINDGDILVVDRALTPVSGDIVIAALDAECTVKYLQRRGGRAFLRAANPTFPDIVPKPGQTLEVWGIVTSSITLHRMGRAHPLHEPQRGRSAVRARARA